MTPRPLHVLLVNDSLGVGGVERVVVTLAQQLSGRGHDVTIAAEPGGALWDDVPSGVRRAHAPDRRGLLGQLRYMAWLAKLIRTGGFDVVHAHQRGVALRARLARSGLRTRVVEHVHNLFPARGAARLLSFRGDELVACGSAIADMVVRDFGRPAERVSTVRNAVPDIGARTDLELPVTTGGAPPRILAVGRVTEQKDPLRFIDVVATLNGGVDPLVHAVWVGDGELLEECLARTERLGIPELRFVGPSDDVAGWLRRSDLLLLTSRWEGLPLVVLEAIAMGRPVIAPDVGSCREAVEDGRSGVLFEVDADAASIAERIRMVLDPVQLARMGSRGRRLYEDRYTLDGQTAEIEAVYNRARDHGQRAT